ncbi:MAG: phosphotransferase [Roseovarius sp.]|uniref:aminoglycoside phosphotransferase family protein n=1 Tax=Roseovarius sp. TaxID=1486281 RepID=UPI001B6446AE|nr:phosphotransferase [Roseovarius sp.]MBQ0752093.1 phosphotransferase [Roseovarius sp.]MBQ0811926.1 phosphotransferase [Roseovarius sp.]
MTDRTGLMQDFLAGTDWAGAAIAPLAGDASNRRYLRLTHATTGTSAVLMDAPPERGEDVRPFLHIARTLTGLSLSAPQILAQDTAHGFLILEDLGDALFARVIPIAPQMEEPLYAAATDVLIDLHRATPPEGLKPYGPETMTEMAALAFDWYLTGTTGENSPQRAEALAALHSLLRQYAGTTDVLVLRDYHAENLLWLPGRIGAARVGLLDFQDAMTGHRAYDLVSVLQDARRDVPHSIETAMITRYCAATGTDQTTFEAAYHCLGAQRNLRILGVFARLCLRDGKAHYIDLMPRVWDHLQRDLDHLALAPVAEILRAALPAPTAAIRERLRAQRAP